MSYPKTQVRRGLANLMWKQMEGLNYSEKFKEKFKDAHYEFLYNLTDQRYAALIIIDKGTVDVKSIRNDKETLSSLNLDGSLAARAELFFNFSSGKMSKLAMLISMLTGKVKIKGMKKMQVLQEALAP